MWELLFNWTELAERGSDALAYMVIALVGTVLFLLRLVVALFGGGDSDFDTDMDVAGHSDASFTFFSLLSILAFFMGAGWMGLACRLDWNVGRLTSSVAAAGFGFLMMTAASALTYLTRRLNREIDYDVGTAIGRTGRVYLKIPPKSEGHGQVEVTISGRRKIVRALSAGPEIPAFRDVNVVGVQDDETLIVEPK